MLPELPPTTSDMQIELAKERSRYAISTFAQSWVLTFKEFFPLFGAWFVSTFMPVVILVFSVLAGLGIDKLIFHTSFAGWWTLAGLLVPGFMLGWLYAGWIYVSLKVARRIPVKFGDFLRPVSQSMSAFFVLVITVILTSLGTACFVLPGALLFMRLQLAPFYVVDQNMGPFAALKRSWHDTRMMFVPLGLLDLLYVGLNFVTSTVIFGPFLCNMGLTVASALVYSQWLTDENHPDMPKLEGET